MMMCMSGGGRIPWSRLLRHITRVHHHFNPPPLYSTKSSTPTISTPFSPNSNPLFFNRSRLRTISPFSTAATPEEEGDDDEEDDGRRGGSRDEDYESDWPDVEELISELKKQEKKKVEESKGEGEGQKEDEEDNDYMGLGKIKSLRERKRDDTWGGEAFQREGGYWSEDDGDDDDDYLDPAELKVAEEVEEQRMEQHDKRILKYNKLLESFTKSSSFDEAYKLMDQIDRFQAEHFAPSNEYKVLGWLLNRLNEATGKERFTLQMKVQRALKHLRWKAEFDPQNPDNWGVMKSGNQNTAEANKEAEEDKEEKKENEGDKKENEGDQTEEKDEDEYSSDEDIEEALNEQVRSIDKEIKRKVSEMELTFGKQSRDLEEEIKELVGQRQSLTVKNDLPLYRKGFDAKLIDVNRTCKVTKGGQVQKYSAIVAVGNFNGIVGYGKAKGRAVPSAIQKAHIKSFENLHYIERYKEHTIAHAIQAKFKKTKLYLWPGAINTGMRANKTIESILYLAGLRDVKSKVIGSRNAENTLKVLFKALNMIETPQDIQEKFGRSVVESYLLK